MASGVVADRLDRFDVCKKGQHIVILDMLYRCLVIDTLIAVRFC